MVEVTDLHMHFGAVRALTGRELHRRATARSPDLLGENGAGKTTTLNIVSGLHEPMRGDCRDRRPPDGDTVETPAAMSAHCSMTRASTAAHRARERGVFGALRGFSGGELARRVQHALAAVGIESHAERRTQGFSQGERMKVALARAIVHEPRNLILDEPTNGLDVPSARAFKSSLVADARTRRLHRVLESSHSRRQRTV